MTDEVTKEPAHNSWWAANIDPDLAAAIVSFKLTIQGKVVARDWRLDSDINYETLEDDLETMPSIFGFWSAVLSEARKKQKLVETRLIIKRAKILNRIAQDMTAGMKMTKDDKDNIVNLDPEYMAIVTESIEVEVTVSKLFGIVDSMRMKSDNLRSLAGFKRAEMQGS